MILSDILDCLLSSYPVLLAPDMQGEAFIAKIPGVVYTYDHMIKLFLSSGDIDHDMAEDLQRFLKDKYHR